MDFTLISIPADEEARAPWLCASTPPGIASGTDLGMDPGPIPGPPLDPDPLPAPDPDPEPPLPPSPLPVPEPANY